jgi:glycosyltransferase involved in cell wall biosynthesis
MGRLCPEKGFDRAIDAARRARVPLLIAGRVFPYPAHQRYFEAAIAPRLDRRIRWIGAVGLARKRRLLSSANCVVVPSVVPETSSLVAMEALACGTPVVAQALGALPEIVEHGRTGFLVHDVDEMADALVRARSLDREACASAARERFTARQMTDRYLALYERIALERGPGYAISRGEIRERIGAPSPAPDGGDRVPPSP